MNGVRWAYLGSVTVIATLAFAACSDDPATPPNDVPDAATTIGTPVNEAGTITVDAASEAAPPCNDAPIDCSSPSDGGADASAATVPHRLQCAGLYACWSNKTVAPDHRAYTPGLVLWSDGAEKSRWLYLPPGQKIDTSNVDDWVFPVGTKVYKEFRVDGKRIETRRIWKISASEWVYSVWRWNADDTDATLFETGGLVSRAGGPAYEIPSTSLCATCHNGHTDKLLGVDAWSLGVAQASGLTLTALKTQGLLSNWPWTTDLAIPEDSTGKFAAAQGWLYNNCAFCHKQGGQAASTGLFMNLSARAALGIDADGGQSGTRLTAVQTPLYLTGVDQALTRPQFTAAFPAGSGYKRIVKGNADLSVVFLAPTRTSDAGLAAQQMPPILRRMVDGPGTTSLRTWITALP